MLHCQYLSSLPGYVYGEIIRCSYCEFGLVPFVAVGLQLGNVLGCSHSSQQETRMPKRQRARRFEPRFGVSQQILETEANHVAREVADYELLATNELKDKEGKLLALWSGANQEVQSFVQRQDHRHRLISRCLLIRDMYHLL